MENEIRLGRTRLKGYPLLTSAFVTFENPIAAHMACQTVIHGSAGYMTPRILPVSIDDVVWDNISVDWWKRCIRTVLGNTAIAVLCVLCVIPVAFAGLLSQIVSITEAIEWLEWVSELPEWSLGALQGLTPPLILGIVTMAFSCALRYLIQKQGLPLRSLVALKLQDYYFCFLFAQVTLIVSLSAGVTATINETTTGASTVRTLAKNLPKASNYFLSYVLLQGLSASANGLLRFSYMINVFLVSPVVDTTVSEKLQRRCDGDIEWGTFVPVYTNLACIGMLWGYYRSNVTNFEARASVRRHLPHHHTGPAFDLHSLLVHFFSLVGPSN
jgi:hypothetical protein